jgi:hypothetical protein
MVILEMELDLILKNVERLVTGAAYHQDMQKIN